MSTGLGKFIGWAEEENQQRQICNWGVVLEKATFILAEEQAEITKLESALKDVPCHADMDALVFENNALRARLERRGMEEKGEKPKHSGNVSFNEVGGGFTGECHPEEQAQGLSVSKFEDDNFARVALMKEQASLPSQPSAPASLAEEQATGKCSYTESEVCSGSKCKIERCENPVEKSTAPAGLVEELEEFIYKCGKNMGIPDEDGFPDTVHVNVDEFKEILSRYKSEKSLAELADEKRYHIEQWLHESDGQRNVWKLSLFANDWSHRKTIFSKTYAEAEAKAREYLNGLK